MAADDEQDGEGSNLVRYAVPTAIVLAVVGAVLYFLHDTAGIRREAPPIATMVATLPPPPPPPPKVEKPPEPEKKLDTPTPKTDEPKPDDAPKPMTEAGPAQAGSDAFGLQAGSGGGSFVGDGNGMSEAAYGHYLGSALQAAIQENDLLNRLVFSVEVLIWLDGSGHVRQVRVLRSSGDATTDEALVAALQGVPSLEAPPSSFQFPQHVKLTGRRPGS